MGRAPDHRQPLDAGQVTGGIHTFNHHFARDPALVLAEGLKEALAG